MSRFLWDYAKKTDMFYLLLCAGSSVFAVTVLISIGVTTIGGFTLDAATGEIAGLGGYSRAFTQAAASLGGLIFAIFISNFDYRHLVKLWPVHVLLTWGLVLPTLLFDNKTFGPLTIGYSNGTENTSWYLIAGFSLQPTELAKISFILTFAMHLNNVRTRINEPKELAKLILHMLIPAVIVQIQGDTGTALIFLIMGACMLFMAGLSWKYIMAGATVAVTALVTAFAFFSDSIGKNYQWLRIQAVLDPSNSTGWAATDAIYELYTYQQLRGETSIGAGQLFGRGLFSGDYYYVPYVWNDFVFSWIGASTGFIGCALVLVVLFLIVFRTLNTGLRSEDLLGTYICTGVAAAMLAQIFVNVGMNVGLMPVIGITLPFYSAGGSSVAMLYISIGIVLSVYMHNKKTLFGNET